MIFFECKHALRSLRRSPAITLMAVVTMALAIGAGTTMFSVANTVLLQPLPYREPAGLSLIWSDLRTRNVRNFMFSSSEFLDLRKQAKSFSQLEAVTTLENIFLRPDGAPERVVKAFITSGFAQMMGAQVVLGRDFTTQDGASPPNVQPGGSALVLRNPDPVILSYDFWKSHYGGDRAVIGKTCDRNTIIGVMQPGFELLFPSGTNVHRKPDLWFCLRLVPDQNRKQSFLHPIGRLSPGVTLDRARREAGSITSSLNAKSAINKTAGFAIRLESMQHDLSAALRPAILALMGAVLFLLLIACANVATLMLIRSGLRKQEWAIRAALGASPWQTARHLMAESLLLGAAGSAFGVVLARWVLTGLPKLRLAGVPRLDTVAFDVRVLSFSVGAGLVAAILIGVGPAFSARRIEMAAVLRSSSGAAALAPAGVLRNVMVVVQIALSFVLLVATGLTFRSFLAVTHTDLGYEPAHLLTFESLSAPLSRADGPRQAVQKKEILRRLGSLPGVMAVTASFPFPLTGNYNPIRWGLEDALTDPGRFRAADFQFVLPGYFETMHSRILEGRVFSPADNVAGCNSVVIDSVLAAKLTPGGRAVGRRFLARVRSLEPEWVEVIGVIAHQRNESPAVDGREQIYFTDAYGSNVIANRYAVRTSGDPAALTAAVRAELRQIDSSIGMFDTVPMAELVGHAAAQSRISLMLLAALASISCLLSGLGLYGVLATTVRARTAEIGLRIAFGAGPVRIFRMVMTRGLGLSAIGLAIGVLAALGLTRVMTAMLVGIKPTDPATFLIAVPLYLALTAIASFLPARRAARLQPASALRDK